MTHPSEFFDAMFEQTDDPWQFRTRWYEIRKRALTLASLPARRYLSAYEPGCANGELSAELAPRCDRLLVSDGSTKAVAAARLRLNDFPQVDVRHLLMPEQWPAHTFDLIVISELGYYLSTTQLDDMARRARQSLRPGGVVVACHWRALIEGCELNGEAVNDRLGGCLGLTPISTIREPDFLLDVWRDDPMSIAQHEGLRP